jgi:hypothetical protein
MSVSLWLQYYLGLCLLGCTITLTMLLPSTPKQNPTLIEEPRHMKLITGNNNAHTVNCHLKNSLRGR